MEIKVRAVEGIEPKGVQELEKELLEKHEQEQNNEPEIVNTETLGSPQSDANDLKEEDVLSYIAKRYNKQINSVEELMAERKEAEELPEDVASYLKYKKETGRGFDDFLKLRKDYDSMDQNEVVKEYLLTTQSGLDRDDIEVMMEDYTYDEELDNESDIKKVKLAKKKIVAEAKKFFNEQKGKYKMPLESSTAGIPENELQEFNAYKQYIQNAKSESEENERRRGWFDKKTNELFSDEFKGFEFNINDKKLSYSPGDAAELKKAQSSPMNFIGKYLDENGLIKDAAGYHKALAIAMNPDRFAKYFYEQGLSQATDDVLRKTKNINMSERKAPEVTSKGGMQIRSLDKDHGKNLKIKSAKRI